MDNFTREELQDLRSRAEFASTDATANIFTKIAYLELAAAADRLDAMLARNELANQNPALWPTDKR
jgi:hypothetical protein